LPQRIDQLNSHSFLKVCVEELPNHPPFSDSAYCYRSWMATSWPSCSYPSLGFFMTPQHPLRLLFYRIKIVFPLVTHAFVPVSLPCGCCCLSLDIRFRVNPSPLMDSQLRGEAFCLCFFCPPPPVSGDFRHSLV